MLRSIGRNVFWGAFTLFPFRKKELFLFLLETRMIHFKEENIHIHENYNLSPGRGVGLLLYTI